MIAAATIITTAIYMSATSKNQIMACVNEAIHKELQDNATSTKISITRKLQLCENNFNARISAHQMELEGFSIFHQKDIVIATKTIEKSFAQAREIRIIWKKNSRIEGYIFFKGI